MKKMIIFSVTGLILILSSSNSRAQVAQDSTVYLVETVDGNKFAGYILEKDTEKLKLLTDKYGTLTIQMKEVKEIVSLEKVNKIDGAYWLPNPQSTRYFWSPNGYGLKAGEAYYQNVWVLFNQFAFGASDNLSLGGGIVPLFLFAGESSPVWFTPKFSIPVVNNKFNVGGGALLGTILGETESGFGILYGITTLGTPDRNISLGLGYGYAAGDWGNSPMINLNGMLRVGPKGYLLTENYYIPSGDNYILLISFGGRAIIKKAGLDYGLFIPAGSEFDQFVAIPWLGITLPFGNVP